MRQDEAEKRRFDLLSRALDEVVREFQALPYEDLLRPSDKWEMSRSKDGHELWFTGELEKVERDGTVLFSVVARGLSKTRGPFPVRYFCKRKDGSVFQPDVPRPWSARGLRRLKYVLIGVLALGVLAWGYLTLLLQSLVFDCADEVQSSVASPDGKWVATVFERDCGATTDFSMQINVRRASETFDGDSTPPVFVAKGRRDVRIAWDASRRLMVTTKYFDVFRKETSSQGV